MTTEQIIYAGFVLVLIVLSANCARRLVLPNIITIPGMLTGLVLSWWFPSLHGESTGSASLIASDGGVIVGAGTMYLLRWAGKVLFGKLRFDLPADSAVVLSQTSLTLPEQDIPYEEIFYRLSDHIEIEAAAVELMLVEPGEEIQAMRFENVSVRLSPKKLLIGNASYDPGQVKRVEIVTDHITLPREAVGLGLVKLAGLIGAFLGWPGTVFAIVSGGIAIVVCQAILSAMKLTENPVADYATPMCVASVVWILARPRWLFAVSCAIGAGAVISLMLNRIMSSGIRTADGGKSSGDD
jgi:prepilin signal peptidase PulO-like enzyme (type II secretory pathway)